MSDISQALAIINGLERDGIIERYAIGGAVGATFYLEPVATLDVDVFIVFRQHSNNLLLSLQPIYDYLIAKGGVIESEHVILAGWPVQFLPPTGPLVEEALSSAASVSVGDIPSRVFTAEHLAAIALQTGRPKDKARLLQFLESNVLDKVRFRAILERHGLDSAWMEFERTFLKGAK